MNRFSPFPYTVQTINMTTRTMTTRSMSLQCKDNKQKHKDVESVLENFPLVYPKEYFQNRVWCSRKQDWVLEHKMIVQTCTSDELVQLGFSSNGEKIEPHSLHGKRKIVPTCNVKYVKLSCEAKPWAVAPKGYYWVRVDPYDHRRAYYCDEWHYELESLSL